ncbi:VOC family protein [Nonomuraea turkmeniaca]|uniref:VOC family protein n=1 Tax=Nonomuraea turkmeniaca TaxID=103838 RepID=UPI0014769EA5|nr:VOC family protein [Nonomuraea turkmeniaca]
MARLRDVVVDCRHPASLARFWAAALDGYAVAPYDEAELARLRAEGVDDPEHDPVRECRRLEERRERSDQSGGRRRHMATEPASRSEASEHVLVEGGSPRLWFQRVPERKIVKNRLHLDLESDDPDAELARLSALGATVLGTYDEWVVLADPEGNEFCLFSTA